MSKERIEKNNENPSQPRPADARSDRPIAIACANQKGGVGKTTTAVHLAVALRRAGHQVQLVDLDPQRNAQLCLSGDAKTGERSGGTLPTWTQEPCTEAEVWIPRAAGGSLEDLDASPADYRIIDCPPSLDGWTRHALEQAHHVLIPLQCEFLAMEGLARILARVAALANRPSSRPAQVHVLPVMLEADSRIHQDILEELSTHLPTQTCTSWVPRDPLFSEAASFGLSLFKYNVRSFGTRSYAKLAREVRDGWT